MFLFKNSCVWFAFLETESMYQCVCGGAGRGVQGGARGVGGGGPIQERLSEIVTPRYLAEGTDSKTVP